MERKSTGVSPFTLKPSTFKKKIKKDDFDVDDLINTEEEELESYVVPPPKNKLLASTTAAIRNFGKKPKKKR